MRVQRKSQETSLLAEAWPVDFNIQHSDTSHETNVAKEVGEGPLNIYYVIA